MNGSMLSLPFLISIATPSVAQQQLTVPSSAALTDAGSSTSFAGLHHASRSMTVIDSGMLTSLLGEEITRVAVRRDARFTQAFAGGATDWQIHIGPATVAAHHAAEAFDANLPPANAVLVFDGTVTIPNSPDASSRSVAWSNPADVVIATLDTPYLYLGGHLCIDVRGTPVAGNPSPFWGIDAALDPSSGSTSTVGSTCGSYHGGLAYPPLQVPAYELVPGSTLRMHARGPAQAATFFTLGAPLSSPGLDLSTIGIGGPGCILHVDPFVTIGMSFDTSSPFGDVGSTRPRLELPADPAVLSFPFRVQLITLANVLETSNAVDCVLASTLPSLGMASIEAPFVSGQIPSRGTVRTNRAPALQLTHRPPS